MNYYNELLYILLNTYIAKQITKYINIMLMRKLQYLIVNDQNWDIIINTCKQII